MSDYRKTTTQADITNRLRNGEISLGPLSLRLLETEPRFGDDRSLDALVEVRWQDIKAKFAVECKSISTPKAFQAATDVLKTTSLPKDCWPMIIMPFLSEDQLQELEKAGISGIDLSGNGVVSVPNRMAVFRTGRRNQFSTSAPIKNVYQRNTSMVGRVLLACFSFKTVQEIRAEVNRRNLLVSRWGRTPMSLATVSKALKTLEGDLIVGRGGQIRLLQPDKLLEKLSENFTPPQLTARGRMKVSLEGAAIYEVLSGRSRELNLPIVATGITSAIRYTVMQRGGMISIYSPRAKTLLESLPGSQTDRFPDFEILETAEETVYFDARQEDGFIWASPVQVYLELMAGDRRDQEAAFQIKDNLLRSFKEAQP
jgi:hypothetical protein